MPTIDPAAWTRADVYRLLIGAVVPRPIAWITTRSATGVVNLAPFSFFNGVTASPPTLSVAIAHRDPVKDTLANLRARGEAVVHIAVPEQVELVHQSGGEYAATISEAEVLGLGLLPSARVDPPRLAGAGIALECRLAQEIPVGNPPTSLCLLEIILAHVADAIARPDGTPDPRLHRGLARLGGRCYLAGSDWPVVELPPQAVAEGLGLERRP
jgi:flavin reductase (DIM6/NTAB) family NADH-FMN oxidoreductase RutF